MKMTREFFDERVATSFDDIALLCSIEAGVSISLLSQAAYVSIAFLFLVGLRLRAKFIDALLALVSKIDPQQISRCSIMAGVFMLIGLVEDPFWSIRLSHARATSISFSRSCQAFSRLPRSCAPSMSTTLRQWRRQSAGE
jgi:hypothetical protein